MTGVLEQLTPDDVDEDGPNPRGQATVGPGTAGVPPQE
jgi:hypothetical protein